MAELCYSAFVSIYRLTRWLSQAFAAQPSAFESPILELVCGNTKSVLDSMPEFRDTGGSWERHGSGIFMTSTSSDVLLNCAKRLRRERKLAPLRFGQWAFITSTSEADRARCVSLADNSDPPNDIALADIAFINSIEAPLRVKSYSQLLAPPGNSWITLDEVRWSNLPRIPITQDLKSMPARAYADCWGTEDWVDTVGQFVSRQQGSDSFPTLFCRAITSEVTRKAKELVIKSEVVKVGPGADACHIVTDSADKLLRLVIWVQSHLASNGAAFLPWALGLGYPEYVENEPSDEEFMKLHRLLKNTCNGDVIATTEFVNRLEREELRSLVTTPTNFTSVEVDGKVMEIRWWQFPFRAISR